MASLCRRLAVASRTGCLTLRVERGDGRVYLRDGTVHTARVSSLGGRLGDRLVGGGHVTQEQLEEALHHRDTSAPDARLGDVLVRLGMLPRETLRLVLREQVLDAISVMLGWTDGEWTFAEGETVAEDTPLGLGMQDALMEGARRLDQLEAIMESMGSMDTVVDFAATGSESRLSLKPDEWAMLTHIDGVNTVAEIADRAGYGELEAARIIYGLLSVGVVTHVEEPAEVVAAQEPDGRQDDPLSTAELDVAADPGDYLAELEGLGAGGSWQPAAPAGLGMAPRVHAEPAPMMRPQQPAPPADSSTPAPAPAPAPESAPAPAEPVAASEPAPAPTPEPAPPAAPPVEPPSMAWSTPAPAQRPEGQAPEGSGLSGLLRRLRRR